MIKNKTFLCRNIPWAESAYHENLEKIYLRTYFNFYERERVLPFKSASYAQYIRRFNFFSSRRVTTKDDKHLNILTSQRREEAT